MPNFPHHGTFQSSLWPVAAGEMPATQTAPAPVPTCMCLHSAPHFSSLGGSGELTVFRTSPLALCWAHRAHDHRRAAPPHQGCGVPAPTGAPGPLSIPCGWTDSWAWVRGTHLLPHPCPSVPMPTCPLRSSFLRESQLTQETP